MKAKAVQICVLSMLFVLGTEASDARDRADRGSAPEAAGPQMRDGQNRRVRIHNQTGRAWTQFQISESGTGAWSDNRLAARGVAPGASMLINFDTGSGACRYDLRAQLEGGGELARTGVNVCAIADYYFTR
jgi:hypothetical protein